VVGLLLSSATSRPLFSFLIRSLVVMTRCFLSLVLRCLHVFKNFVSGSAVFACLQEKGMKKKIRLFVDTET